MTKALERGRKSWWWSAWAVAALTLAGCGGSGGGGSGGDGGGTPPPPSSFALTVSVTGNGSLSTASGSINCGTSCSTTVATNTAVTLTATPAAGSVLQLWGGACAGTSGNSCTVTVTQATAASATFVAQGSTTFPLAVTVSGSGRVGSQPVGIDCGSTCSASYAASTSVVLTATPGQGQVFQAWSGACSGSSPTCTVAMSAARNVGASFIVSQGPALAWGTATLLENSNDFNVADTNTFADTNLLSAIDGAGNALVVWEQSDGLPNGSTRKVFSRRYVAGQGWAAAVQVPNLSTSSSSVDLVTGQLLMDAAGNAVWIRHNFETRRYSAVSGWSATAFVPPASGSGELADAEIDASGDVHMLGIGSNDVLYSRLAAGGSQWTAWADVSFTDLATRDAQLALGAQGGLIAVWRERNPGDSNDSMKANRLVGSAWQTPVRIEEVLTDVSDSSRPRIATDASGNAVVAWHQGSSLYVNRYDAATAAWGTASEVDAGQVNSGFSARIQIAMVADGRAVIAWSSGIFAVKAMSYAPGSGFTAPAQVNSYSSGHALGIGPDGRAVLAYRSVSQWPNPTDATQNLYARDLPWGGSWSAATLLETGVGDVKANVPCMTNAAGQSVCTWAQDDIAGSTVRNSLWANLRR